MSDATFAQLAKFAESGGRVVVFGKEALLANEYGKPRPERKAVCDRLFRRENFISTRQYHAVLADELACKTLRPPVGVKSPGGGSEGVFGVVSRTGRTSDGRRTLLLANVLVDPAKVDVPGRYVDAITGESVSGAITLAPGAVRALTAEPGNK